MQTAAALNRRFAIPDRLHFTRDPGGLVLAVVENRAASARIALQGAHLMAYQPHGQAPLLWLSDEARLAPGKSIRGGVPICWPWFGAAADTGLPAHGYARTADWRLIQAQALSEQATRLEFELVQSPASRAMWPYPAKLRQVLTIGPNLDIELQTTNTGSAPLHLSSALHTYFQIGDIRRIRIHGLDACDYLDKVEGFARKRQAGAVAFAGEVDRIYLDTGPACEIRDPVLKRRILITSSGSHSTVVWNPWREKAAQMGDMGSDGYRHMVCVETANAADDSVELAPGAVHRLCSRYTLGPY